jgi:hypothetical protein
MKVKSFLKKANLVTASTLLAACIMTTAAAPKAGAAGPCGSACNNKPPSFNSCSSSAVQVGQGSPAADYGRIVRGTPEDIHEVDTHMIVKVMYSPACETLWGVVTNTQATGRTGCDIVVARTITPKVTYHFACPSAGTGPKTTNMIDDHSPTHGIAGLVKLDETMVRIHTDDGGTNVSGNVHFIYSKEY